jgi:hypothetical protein
VILCRAALADTLSIFSGYQRGPWTTNGPSPVCVSNALLDPPGHRRGTPANVHVKGQPGQPPRPTPTHLIPHPTPHTPPSSPLAGTEYAYFADASTTSECVARCCSDWSCWGFTYYPVGRIGSNDEPAGPGHSCDGTTPCCVLLNDMHDPVLASGGNLLHTQSGVRAKLPARWDRSFEASPLIKSVHFGSKLYIGGDGTGGECIHSTHTLIHSSLYAYHHCTPAIGGEPAYPKGRTEGGWDLGDDMINSYILL